MPSAKPPADIPLADGEPPSAQTATVKPSDKSSTIEEPASIDSQPQREPENRTDTIQSESSTPFEKDAYEEQLNNAQPSKSEKGTVDTFNDPARITLSDKTSFLEKEELFALLEDTITVSLRGEGWIYTGEKNDKEGLTFLSREPTDETSDFLFQAARKDIFILEFQKHIAEAGETYLKQVTVTVVEEDTFAELISSSGGVNLGSTHGEVKGDYSLAERLYRNHRFADALEEYIERYKPGNPSINRRIAELSFSLKQYHRASSYWQKNMSFKGKIYDQAVHGIVKAAVALKDQETLDLYLEEFIQIESVDIRNTLLEATEMEIEYGFLMTAVELLETYALKYPRGDDVDYVYFTLGTLYEKKSNIQDVEKAINYYTIVTEEFPASQYWLQAEDRKKYLKRAFLQIR